MKNVLVTGGCGFIGSHLVERLWQLGCDVTVIDDLSSDNDKFHYNLSATYFEDSVTDYDAIKPRFENIDTVFHLAAESRIGPSMENPQRACEVNFMGTFNVLQATRERACKRVVYSSTSACYGLKNKPPLHEEMKNDNLNPYSVSKLAAEDLCMMYNNTFNLETIALRYFNVFGERMPQKGQYAPVLAVFLRQRSAGEDLTVVGDGLQSRDFVYVQDIVQANILAAETVNANCGEVYNVGTGSSTTVLAIAQSLNHPYIHVPARSGESRATLADNKKITEKLHWSPTKSIQEWIDEQEVK